MTSIVSNAEGEAHVVAVPEVAPITDAELAEVGRFLGDRFPPDTPGDEWAEAWQRTVNLAGSEAPNHGFLLRAGGRVVGAYPAIYSTRVIAGRKERFCNLAVWYVAPEYRRHSARLVRAMLAQPDWHFTDLTPIEAVQKLNERLGFQYLDTAAALIPNFPWLSLGSGVRIVTDPGAIATALSGADAVYYRDHADCRWARHLVLLRGDEWCYVQWRMERRKKLRVFAAIQYVSHPPLFRQAYRLLGSHLLLRHGALATLAELRVAGGRVAPSLLLPRNRKRMFRSDRLGAEAIDYLYSEITSAP